MLVKLFVLMPALTLVCHRFQDNLILAPLNPVKCLLFLLMEVTSHTHTHTHTQGKNVK